MRQVSLATAAVPVALLWISAGCAAANPSPDQCGPRRTLLDGVCVAEQVADYVSCVRAQGAKLSQDKGQKLSADVGIAGTRASAAAEVSDRVQREYQSASDANALMILRSCEIVWRKGETAALDVSGSWQSTFENGGEAGTLVIFVQNGNRIQGTYGDGGRYEGALDGRVLSGIWVNGKSSGRFRFELAEDGKSFSGRWGFGSAELTYWQRGQR